MQFQDAATLLSSYTYTFPAITGTLALLEGTQTFSGVKTFSENVKIDAGIRYKKNPAIQTASAGYLTTYGTSGFGLSFFDGDSGNESKLAFNDTSNYTYTFPDLSGTLALLEGTQTFTGEKVFNNNALFNSVLSVNYGAWLQKGVPSATYSSAFTTLYSEVGAINAVFRDNTNQAKLQFQSASNYTYTFPASSGTIALTSDLSGYLPLSGGTLSGALTIGVAAGTGLDVASDLVIFRASTGFGSPRQITLAAGNGPTTYLEAKGYGGNYITDFGIRTYNSSGTAFEVFFATSAGNVGIGNTAPAAKLDVNGSGRFTGALSGTSATFSGAFGTGSGVYLSGTTYGTYGANRGATSASAGMGYFSVGSQKWFSGIFENTDDFGFYSTGTNSFPLVIKHTTGNVGIGTSSPSVILNTFLNDNLDSVQIRAETNTSSVVSYTGLGASFLEYYRGIATGVDLTIQTKIDAAGTGGNIVFAPNSSSTSYTPVERMRITKSGYVLIGTTTDLGANLVIGGTGATMRVLPATDNVGYVGESTHRWVAIYAVNGAIQTSDRNEKTNIIPSELGLNYIMKLNPVSYSWKKDDGKKHYGLIAQEIEELGIEFGGLDIENGKYGLNYSEFIAPLVKAIQESHEIIKDLEARIVSLESK